MGIDKTKCKTCIANTSEFKNYYQEAGRAGRNEEKALQFYYLILQIFCMPKDQILDSLPDVPFFKIGFQKLCSFLKIAYGEGLMKHFTV
jgi:ATP-dependent DNA helicase RecQ